MPNWVRISLVVLFVVSYAGCGMSRTQAPLVSDVVSIESPASLAGVWKGTAWRASRLWTDGDVRVSIAPGGYYVAWSDGGPAPEADAGRLLVVDGKLVPDRQNVVLTLTLVQSHGNTILVAEVTGEDGIPYYVPLVRDAP